ncbi:MAG: hypothetical protein Q9200_004035 [Gallowayella weberi]
MRTHTLIIVLLAVISNQASAGLLRYNERPVRAHHHARSFNHHHARSFNQSSIAPALSQSTQSTSTSGSTLSTPTSPSVPISVLPTSLSKQVGSVPAEGSGPNAAKIDTKSLTLLPSTTKIDTPQSSEPASTSSKQIGSVPAQGSGPGAATFNIESIPSASSASTSATASSGQGYQSVPVSSTQLTSPSVTVSSSIDKPATTFATRFSLGTGITTPATQPQSSRSSLATSPADSESDKYNKIPHIESAVDRIQCRIGDHDFGCLFFAWSYWTFAFSCTSHQR